MALRLAGETHDLVQGLDAYGWLRDIQVNDGTPGLKVNQGGSGRIFDFQDGGDSRMFMLDGGKTLLGNAANPPDPDTLLHVWGGSVGAIAASLNAVLTLENSTHEYLQLLTPNNADAGLLFGDVDQNNVGELTYGHASDRLQFKTGGLYRLYYSAGAFAFQEATTISTSAGDLALNPAGNVKFGTHSSLGSETVTGYITVKDSAGTLRKLAIVS